MLDKTAILGRAREGGKRRRLSLLPIAAIPQRKTSRAGVRLAALVERSAMAAVQEFESSTPLACGRRNCHGH